MAIVFLLLPYQTSAQITPPLIAPLEESTEAPIIEDSPLVADEAVAEQMYQDWLVVQQSHKVAVARHLPPKSGRPGVCSCVTYVKGLTGYDAPVGNARNWPKNSRTPVVGGVVVTAESRVGHVAYIVGISGGTLILSEANYSRCRVTQGRTLNENNPTILGYWSP